VDRHEDARRLARETERDLDRGTYISQAAAQITLSEYGADWLAGLIGDASTREAVALRWRVHIEPGLGKHPLGHLAQRPSTIQQWVAGLLRSGSSPSYIGEIVKTLGACLTAAMNDHIIAANPVSEVTRPKPPQRRVVPWTMEMVTAVRAALPAHYAATVDAGAGLGLRQGEVFGLALDDIDWMRRVVHVRRQVRIIAGQLVYSPPKGGRERDVPLPESLALRLSAHLREHPAREIVLPWREPGGKQQRAALVFASRRDGAVNKNSFNHGWRDALDAAGITRGRENGFHALRHYFASAALAGGVDIRALSEYLGHHSPGFTLSVYTHLMPSAPDRMRAAIDAVLTVHSGGQHAGRGFFG
jgi:integrase